MKDEVSLTFDSHFTLPLPLPTSHSLPFVDGAVGLPPVGVRSSSRTRVLRHQTLDFGLKRTGRDSSYSDHGCPCRSMYPPSLPLTFPSEGPVERIQEVPPSTRPLEPERMTRPLFPSGDPREEDKNPSPKVRRDD